MKEFVNIRMSFEQSQKLVNSIGVYPYAREMFVYDNEEEMENYNKRDIDIIYPFHMAFPMKSEIKLPCLYLDELIEIVEVLTLEYKLGVKKENDEKIYVLSDKLGIFEGGNIPVVYLKLIAKYIKQDKQNLEKINNFLKEKENARRTNTNAKLSKTK